MLEAYNDILCIHSLDTSTDFLCVLKEIIPNYHAIEADDGSLKTVLEKLKSLKPMSLVLFLGHGDSRGIHAPTENPPDKAVLLDVAAGEILFDQHDLILLSCRSAEFIGNMSTYNRAIGFGNIISSLGESSAEAEVTGRFRDLQQEDIDYFNYTYVTAIAKSIKLLLGGVIAFREVAGYITFCLNKEINTLLRQKNKANKIEVSRLLFEFRNELEYK
jgi:hypothetical protein